MTGTELRKLIANGEGQYLEFKKKADHPDKIVREMVAFANSGGGILLIGIDDNGTISGLPFPEEDRYVMEAAIIRYSRPAVSYRLEIIPVGQGRSVLQYIVPDGTGKPYFWLSDKLKNSYSVYVRSKDQCLRASYEMFRFLASGRESESVTFGPVELLLLAELGKSGFTTIRDFVQISGLGRKKVSALFISLCLRGMLQIIPGESHDLFRLSASFRN